MPTTPYNRAGPGQPIPSYDDWTLQHRGTMAPWGVYERNGETASGFAWPAMVTEPVEAGKRFLSPGGGFENLPNQQSEQDALTLLMSLYGGNALSGTVKGAAATNALADMGRALSDTGRPNAVGAALASNENAVRSFHGTRYNVKGQFIPSDDGLLGPGVYSSVDPQKAGAHSGYNRGSIENPVMNYEHGKIFPFDVAQPVATEADWMRVLSDMEGAAPRVDQDRSVAVRAQQALANEGFGSVRYGDTVNTFAKGNITSPLTGETLFSDTRPSLMGSAIASGAEQGPMRVYHGTDAPSFDKFSGHPWFTPDSRFADFYANGKEFGSDYRDGARVIAGEISPKNPYMVPRGMEIDGGYALSDLDEAANHFGLNPERVDWPDIENAAKASGHDFMVHDINDPGGRQLQYQALAEGSVRSPYTGETLFSDTRPSLLGSALASSEPKNALAAGVVKVAGERLTPEQALARGARDAGGGYLVYDDVLENPSGSKLQRHINKINATRQNGPDDGPPIRFVSDGSTPDSRLLYRDAAAGTHYQFGPEPYGAGWVASDGTHYFRNYALEDQAAYNGLKDRVKQMSGRDPQFITQDEYYDLVKAGKLYSDTGRPSLMGSAVAGMQDKNVLRPSWGNGTNKLMEKSVPITDETYGSTADSIVEELFPLYTKDVDESFLEDPFDPSLGLQKFWKGQFKSNLADAVASSYLDGMTHEQLQAAVRKRLGFEPEVTSINAFRK